MSWIPLNWQLLRVWQNWFIVVLIVFIGGLGLALLSHSAMSDTSSEE